MEKLNRIAILLIILALVAVKVKATSVGTITLAIQNSTLKGNQSSPATTGYGGNVLATGGCTYNWTCIRWSECMNGVQTRTCANLGSCLDNKGKPVESRSCSMPSIPASITPPTNITPPAPAPSPTPVSTPAPASTSAPVITSTAPVTPLGLGTGLIAIVAISIVITAIILKKRKQDRRLFT